MTKHSPARRAKVALVAALAAVVVCGGVSLMVAHAQAPGGGFPGAGGPNGGGPGGFPGGPGRFGGRPGGNRPTFGTVSAVDAGASTITVNTMGGNPVTVQTSGTTTIVTKTTIAVTDLKVGDKIQVTGVPTGITASSILSGSLPPAPAGIPGMPTGAAGAAGAPVAAPETAPPAPATETGTVTATSPLTISLPGGLSLTVTTASNATVSKLTAAALGDLKVGDQIVAQGTTGADGTVTATWVGDGVTMADMGPSLYGRGGFGGFGGFGRRGGGGQGFGGGGGFNGGGGGAPPAPPAPPAQ